MVFSVRGMITFGSWLIEMMIEKSEDPYMFTNYSTRVKLELLTRKVFDFRVKASHCVYWVKIVNNL